MNIHKVLTSALLLLCIALIATTALADSGTWWREDFDSLASWKHQEFDNIDVPSNYSIIPIPGGFALKTLSTGGASGLTTKTPFNIYKHPVLAWRWKVDNIIDTADGTIKAGDDYPLRVYVVFTYDPQKARGFAKFKYSIAKLMYGDYPPHSTLTYVWANKESAPDHFRSPYTDQAAIIPLQRGKTLVGTWQDEEVNVVEDYRRAFGEDPPAKAALAIMTDTDNTKTSATAYIDWIELRDTPQ